MDAAIKARWVEALRSGEYDQAQSVLVSLDSETQKPVGFCCLGVLCDLAEKDGIVTSRVFHPNDRELVRAYGDESEHALLPRVVREWAGFASDVRSPTVDVTQTDEEWGEEVITQDLAEMNDNGYGFGHIADLIEAQL